MFSCAATKRIPDGVGGGGSPWRRVALRHLYRGGTVRSPCARSRGATGPEHRRRNCHGLFGRRDDPRILFGHDILDAVHLRAIWRPGHCTAGHWALPAIYRARLAREGRRGQPNVPTEFFASRNRLPATGIFGVSFHWRLGSDMSMPRIDQGRDTGAQGRTPGARRNSTSSSWVDAGRGPTRSSCSSPRMTFQASADLVDLEPPHDPAGPVTALSASWVAARTACAKAHAAQLQAGERHTCRAPTLACRSPDRADQSRIASAAATSTGDDATKQDEDSEAG